jgi:hypothetical protein
MKTWHKGKNLAKMCQVPVSALDHTRAAIKRAHDQRASTRAQELAIECVCDRS